MRVEPFNLTYFLMFILGALFVILITWACKNKSERTKRNVLLVFSLYNILLFIIQRSILAIGTDTLKNINYEFNILQELPLHLCNISLFLTPLGLLLNKKWICSYGFYVAPLGAFMALTFPDPTTAGLNAFEPHVYTYLAIHLNIILLGVMLVTLGFYKPTFKNVPILFIFVCILALSIFGIDLFLTSTTNAKPNYFYLMHPNDISILKLFWSLIPIKCLYLIFALPVFGIYTFIITLPFYLFNKKKKQKS